MDNAFYFELNTFVENNYAACGAAVMSAERAVYGAAPAAQCDAVPVMHERLRVSRAARRLEDVVGELEETFSESLLRLIDDKGMTDVEVYKRAGLDRKHFSKIRGDRAYRPKKSTAVYLSLGLKLSLDETKDLLSRAGYALSHSNIADVIAEFFITEKEYDVTIFNEALAHFGAYAEFDTAR